ncbi:MAG: hypothetical protein Q7R47_00440 [Candidatus Diapherotrites archaeon]|nr:hypothetical protein [Candidatus Diapherotrites archaeon]
MRKATLAAFLVLLSATSVWAFTIRVLDDGITRRLTSPDSTPQCITTTDCPAGMACSGRRCVESAPSTTIVPLDPPDTSALAPTTVTSTTGTTTAYPYCAAGSDCRTGERCTSGVCTAEPESKDFISLILDYLAKIRGDAAAKAKSPPVIESGYCTSYRDCPAGELCRANECKTMAEIIAEGTSDGTGIPTPEPSAPTVEPSTGISSELCQIYAGEEFPVSRNACTATPASGRELEIINDLEGYTDEAGGTGRHQNIALRVLYAIPGASPDEIISLVGPLDGLDCTATLPGIYAGGDFAIISRMPDGGALPAVYDIRPHIGQWDAPYYEYSSCWRHNYDTMVRCDGYATDKSRTIRINHPDNTKITVHLHGFFPNNNFALEGYCG